MDRRGGFWYKTARMAQSLEIRVHGRGGQGGVTCAKILAAAYARLGRHAQTFGDYAGERSGAPVRAYTRVSDQPITNRNKVYDPEHLLVLDDSLLGEDTLDGLVPGGTLLLNTAAPLDSLGERYDRCRLATVDATEIARRHKIGTRSVVIVNTTIAGAYARLFGIALRTLEETYEELGLASNFPAAREAYESVVERPPRLAPAPRPDGKVPLFNTVFVEPLTAHLESPPTGLRTGSWSTQRPVYAEKLAPCNAWCPAGNDVVGFLQTLRREGEAAAAAVLGRSTPLAGVCGRVCPAPCMEGCNRREYDGSVHIRGLERWISDHTPVAVRTVVRQVAPFRVAIVGGGPAGIAAAYELAKAGHAATIFEGEKELGGVLRTGIPAYRLAREVVDREIGDVLSLGVEARCGEFLDPARLEALAAEFDAVVLATGLQRLTGLRVPGAELAGIEQGIRFLHRVNLEGGVRMDGHVVVLGGGNTAMDCARSALRAGADRVTIAYRRTRLEMPAIREEVEEAEHEGVRLLMQRQPIAFHGEGRVREIVLAEVTMGEPDESGRRRPVVTDATSRFECDHVLLALGQGAQLGILPDGWELRGERVHRGGTPLAVFAAGDLATGDGTVTHAVGNGRRVAGLVLQALGEDVEPFARPDRRHAVPITNLRLDHFPRAAPAQETCEPAADRRTRFAEVNHGLPDGSEADRCFSCGHCTRCDTCLVYCPEGIIRRRTADSGYEIDYTYCKGCGLCVEECPREAMTMTTL
ncbi:MAG: 2-oxoacid:acceptor oxidoreductase family protein [Planctomycetota bacterium]